MTPWSAETTEAAVRAFAETNNLKLGAVAQPLRVALTGRTTSPGIFDVLAVLGRQECLARLGDQASLIRLDGSQATAILQCTQQYDTHLQGASRISRLPSPSLL